MTPLHILRQGLDHRHPKWLAQALEQHFRGWPEPETFDVLARAFIDLVEQPIVIHIDDGTIQFSTARTDLLTDQVSRILADYNSAAEESDRIIDELRDEVAKLRSEASDLRGKIAAAATAAKEKP